MTSAREQILGTLRSMPTQNIPQLPDVLTSESGQDIPVDQRIATFTAVLDKLGAPVDLVADLPTASRRISDVLSQHGATSLALSDADAVLTVAKELPETIVRVHHDAQRQDLLTSDAGLSTVQWAIAETGTLALVSQHERHRLSTLLPDLHIALVPASKLLATLGDAFGQIAPNGTPDGQTITFITGPSRTADIELELVVGVHGPKALHVLILLDA